MGPSQDELWAAVADFDAALATSPQIVQTVMEEQRLRWNALLGELAELAKENGSYEGETSDELVELLARRLEG